MNNPSSKPVIPVGEFFWYVIGAATLAGVAICDNPTWPVVIGVVALCAIVALVFRYAWSNGILKSNHDSAVAVQRQADGEGA